MRWRRLPRSRFKGERQWLVGFNWLPTKDGHALTVYLGWWTFVRDTPSRLFDLGVL